MKTRLFKLSVLVAAIALLIMLLPGGTLPVTAQRPQPTSPVPPNEPGGGGEAYQTKEGLWVMPAGSKPSAPTRIRSPQATGGPDQFGYTWNDSVALSWIDATTGTDTGMSGSSGGKKVGPISLPFSFKYYENTYNSVYIAASGYLGFTDYGTWPVQPRVPSLALPNNMIAPYATEIYLNTAGPYARVYYKSGGVAPNRYFVVEWFDVKGGPPSDTIGNDDTYRFEVILYENGDIVFQYQTMTINGSYYCGSTGIEDSTGLDGLAYGSFCYIPPSNKAIRFYRPAPSARVSVYPQYAGRFTTVGATESFHLQVRNTGEFGSDTYDLTSSSTWPVSLYAADGSTPLTDTDSDGVVDTGSLAQGSTFTVTVKVQTPSGANVGNANTATITARSSLDTTKQKASTVQTAVPANFAQVYRDNADDAMSLYLVQPVGQTVKKATSDNYLGDGMAVAEMPNGNLVYAWHKWRSLGSVVVREIEYTLLDHLGNITRAVTKLTDHSGATMTTYDYYPAVAVAPNGRIGVLWYRYLYNSSTSQNNYNIYFAVLDAAGNVVVAPINLTNNTAWGTWSDLNVPRFYSPRIAATGDNRFVLAWLREHLESNGWVDDIYYAVRDSNGNEVKASTKLTEDTPGTSGYLNPALASLSLNRAFLSWASRQQDNDDIYYAVIGSDGNLVKTATDLSVDETVVDWRNYDAVQLSDGKILAVWEAWGCFAGEWVPRLRFALLDTSYNRIGTPTCLGNAPATLGDFAASVTADTDGHGILTWMDYDSSNRRNLYYALVDSTGSVLTQPMIFRTSQASSPYIISSYWGYGNTSYSPLWLLYLPLILR